MGKFPERLCQQLIRKLDHMIPHIPEPLFLGGLSPASIRPAFGIFQYRNLHASMRSYSSRNRIAVNSELAVPRRSASEVRCTFVKAAASDCPALETGLAEENSSIHTKVSNNLSQRKHMKLAHGFAPLLALDDPDDVKSDMVRADKDVNIVLRPHTVRSVIGCCVVPQAPKESRDLLLVFLPSTRHTLVDSLDSETQVGIHEDLGLRRRDHGADASGVGVFWRKGLAQLTLRFDRSSRTLCDSERCKLPRSNPIESFTGTGTTAAAELQKLHCTVQWLFVSPDSPDYDCMASIPAGEVVEKCPVRLNPLLVSLCGPIRHRRRR